MSVKQSCIDAINERIQKRSAAMNQEVAEMHQELETARAMLHDAYPERVRSVWTLLNKYDYPSQPKDTRRPGSYSLSRDELARVSVQKKRVERIREQMDYMQKRHSESRIKLDGMREAATVIKMNVDE